MNLSALKDKRIAIWGLGKEGLESFRFIRAQFPEKHLTVINNHRLGPVPEDDNIRFILEQDLTEHIDSIDIIIKSPGISLYHPLVNILKQNHIQITSATNIWFSLPRTGTTIAITGSNGKSTSCALLAHILKGLGRKTELGGNIGTPLLSLSRDAGYYVIELSSYQAADLNSAPDIAVLLNLFPEHIQWHKSHAQYYNDKTNLIRLGAKINILNKTDRRVTEFIPNIPPATLWFNDRAGLHCDGELIMSNTTILGAVSKVALLGRHNYENICAALTICQALKLDLKDCFKLAASYRGLPHRLENLHIEGDYTYINDSISTTPEATLAALKCFKNRDITLLIGGQDRSQNHGELVQYIAEQPKINIIMAYETAPKIQAEFQDIKLNNTILNAIDLKDSVIQAKKITPKGGIILLSPAAPSYDAFLNFEQRAKFFKSYCQNIV